MIFIISPAKTMDFNKLEFETNSNSSFIEKSKLIINELKKLSSEEIQKKLKVNEKIANVNLTRYKNWKSPHSYENTDTKQAIFTYSGHLFKNIEVNSLKNEELEYLQKNLLIFSTLYGALKPFDLIMPYRLDFLSNIKIKEKNLYDFWKKDITEYLNKIDTQYLINLASNEYFKAIDKKLINKKVIDIVFKEFKNGKYKTISMSAKKMRGRFINFIAKNNIDKLEQLKEFNYDDYKFSEKESNENCFTFLK